MTYIMIYFNHTTEIYIKILINKTNVLKKKIVKKCSKKKFSLNFVSVTTQ